MIKTTGLGIAGLSLMGADALAQSADTKAKNGKKLKILAIGAHPDDPESTCGGTIAKMVKAGHDVVAVYMTHGERGISGVSLEESARIRTAEAEAACKVLGCRHIFLTQIDGATEINPARYQEFIDLMKAEKPDIVLTHWPIDSHRDHAICSILTIDAWRRVGGNFDLYFHEAMTGIQSKTFNCADVLVDISDVIDIKTKAMYCHTSQDIPDWYDTQHRTMERYHGYRCGVEYAEAFIRFDQSPTKIL